MRKKRNLNEETMYTLETIILLINELKINDKFQAIIREQENLLSLYNRYKF